MKMATFVGRAFDSGNRKLVINRVYSQHSVIYLEGAINYASTANWRRTTCYWRRRRFFRGDYAEQWTGPSRKPGYWIKPRRRLSCRNEIGAHISLTLHIARADRVLLSIIDEPPPPFSLFPEQRVFSTGQRRHCLT